VGSRLRPKHRKQERRWARTPGPRAQTGLLVTLVAATAFFGTPSTIAMLRMMLIGVLLFVPGWWLCRRDPRA
jgi:hypothetical protein